MEEFLMRALETVVGLVLGVGLVLATAALAATAARRRTHGR
jgi:hypothetical protein